MKNNILIAPSLLAADYMALGTEVDRVIAAGADMLHIDVMDNHYVPNLTFGPILCQSLAAKNLAVPLDVHLMVQPVDEAIKLFAISEANYITIHAEATTHLHRSLQLIKKYKCKAGVALNPATSLAVIEHILDELDILLIMGVNPGFGGQTFIPAVLKKISQAKQLLEQHNSHALIQVDGGINGDNITAIVKSGADIIVAGNAIFNTQDYTASIQMLKNSYR